MVEKKRKKRAKKQDLLMEEDDSEEDCAAMKCLKPTGNNIVHSHFQVRWDNTGWNRLRLFRKCPKEVVL